MKKNILFVVDERKIGGVSILLEDMMNMMDISNLNIDILSLHNNGDCLVNLPTGVNLIFGTKYFDIIDLTIQDVLKTKNMKLIYKKVKLIIAMKTGLIKRKLLKEREKILKRDYDIEIAFKDGFTALFVGVGNCKNKIHWLHYDYKFVNANRRYDKLFKEILPKFNKIIAVSKGVQDDFNNIYHLEEKTQVINNIINVNKIMKLSSSFSKNKSNNIEIISVGRLHYVKGYSRLIEALRRIDEEGLLNNCKIKLYGDGPEKDNLTKQIYKNNLNDKILLMGKIDNPYIEIKKSDLFVLSSLYETFGLVIVEAMSLGIPVLATETSATSELIKNNYNGMIVDNSIDGIYKGLKKIISNRKLLLKYKNNLEKYDYRKENEKILKQLNKLFS